MHHAGTKWRRMIVEMLLVCFIASTLFTSALALDDVSKAQLSTAVLLADQDLAANTETIRILLETCIAGLDEADPVRGTLQSIVVLLDSGNANAAAVTVLLKSVIDTSEASDSEPEPAPEPEVEAEPKPEPDPESELEPETTEEPFDDTLEPSLLGLPVFEVDAFIKAVFQEEMLVDVPRDWGNNASGRELTSYSPVNDSGAISPSAGTLTISYFPAEGNSDDEAFDSYTKNIAGMSVTTSLTYEDVTAASLPARKIDFTMSVGANQFSCETVCFAHESTVYAIELMQGQQTEYDYFPVYHRIVRSAKVGDAQQIAETLEKHPEDDAKPSTLPVKPDKPPEESPSPGPMPQMPESRDVPRGDMSSFLYAINGHAYQFPTSIRQIDKGDLPLDYSAVIPYDFCSDADMLGGAWTEIVNTQYYYFENALHKEMAGVTNMSGYPVNSMDCMLTALIDTGGSYVNITLPGDVHVGGKESDIYNGFPEFKGRSLDGLAGFRGNELLYACNVRDDGCHGYVLIRNDAPYYSAVSIICSEGNIIEISFECLGSERAKGVFL